MKSPLFSISVVFLIGIIAASSLPPHCITFYAVLMVAFVSLVLSLVFFKFKIASHIFLYILIFFTGFIRFVSFNESAPNHIKFIAYKEPKKMFIKGVVCSNPIFKRKFGYYPELEYLLNVGAVKESDRWAGSSGLLLIKQYFNGDQAVNYGDKLLLEGQTLLVNGKDKASKSFGYEKYLQGKKIYAVCKIKESDFVKKTGEVKNIFIYINRFLYSVRNSAKNRIFINLAPPHSGILSAILLGERQDMDKSLKDSLIRTGTLHIIAISGLHVGIIVFIFLGLFRLIEIPRKIAYTLIIILIYSYALMIGQIPSVWRSVIMASVVLLGFVMDRDANILNTFSLSFLILSFACPNYLFDAGFILSFACIGSIIWISPVTDILLGLHKTKPKGAGQQQKITFYLLKSLSVSTGVWFGIMPIIAYFFHIITPVTILANLVAIPLSFVLISIGIAALLFNPFLPNLSMVLYETIWLTDNIMLWSLKVFSKLPFAYTEIKSFPFVYIFIYYILLASIILLFKYRVYGINERTPVRKKIVTFL